MYGFLLCSLSHGDEKSFSLLFFYVVNRTPLSNLYADVYQLHAEWTGAEFCCRDWRQEMFDALLIVAGMAFFAVAIAYVEACDRL
jgi:hypothetical protein